jgi:hypothetical protein
LKIALSSTWSGHCPFTAERGVRLRICVFLNFIKDIYEKLQKNEILKFRFITLKNVILKLQIRLNGNKKKLNILLKVTFLATKILNLILNNPKSRTFVPKCDLKKK